MAMVMMAAVLLMVVMMKMTTTMMMFSMTSKMIRLSTQQRNHRSGGKGTTTGPPHKWGGGGEGGDTKGWEGRGGVAALHHGCMYVFMHVSMYVCMYAMSVCTIMYECGTDELFCYHTGLQNSSSGGIQEELRPTQPRKKLKSRPRQECTS